MHRVSNFMTHSPISVEPQTNLHVALSLMERKRIRHLCVMEGARLVGILSERDILEVAPSKSLGEVRFAAGLINLRVAEHMSRKPRIAHPDMRICEAAEHMSNIGAHSLPVVEDGRVLGIVTASDCIRALGVYVSKLEEVPRSARDDRF